MVPTGFGGLDTYLSGGMRAGELTLLGGPQGLGKTALALQLARNVASAGGSAVYFSFEHDAATMLERLVAIEAGCILGEDGVTLRRVRQAMEGGGALGSLAERLAGTPAGPQAVEAVASYGDRLFLHRALGTRTDLDEIWTVARSALAQGGTPLLVVDYLQKVHVPGEAPEDERVTRVVEGLKDLALDLGVPVLAIVAADKEGLSPGKRLRAHQLRGSSALAYEADVVLVLNNKYDVVARHHLVYDTTASQRFHAYVVLSIEKNRGGVDRVDLEMRKRFEQSRFDDELQPVAEQLVDERLFIE
ncbi:DnaB-like helicase C-terminal domain-containing protein [Aquipuribacter sp. SD81]|uniref:DnaB-like helicase C-terminal domain-containing protein n=1 Tax=Aquipuribacter sp. SD81 TaxID=3127703 RepID=UPI0030159DB1